MASEISADWIQKVLGHIQRNNELQEVGFEVEVIGDGNLNDVQRVIDIDDDRKTVVVKHAPPYVKCLGPNHPLSVVRSETEYEGLCWFDRIAPGCVPEPYGKVASHHSFLMEDLRGYEVMKKQLVRGRLNLDAGRKIIRYMNIIHKQTTKEKLGEDRFNQLKSKFENIEMVSLTRAYIFTNPFLTNDPTNRCSPEVADHLHLIYDDDGVLRNASELRSIFLEKKDCLLHGDLHTGSIMTKDSDAKMIDLEFAFVGPMGFDLGLLLANYLFSYHAHRKKPNHTSDRAKFDEEVRKAIFDAISLYFGDVESRLPNQALTTLAREVVGFAGCELIRRIVGVAHVEDLEGNPEAEIECLQLGVNLVLGYKNVNFDSAEKLMSVFGLT